MYYNNNNYAPYQGASHHHHGRSQQAHNINIPNDIITDANPGSSYRSASSSNHQHYTGNVASDPRAPMMMHKHHNAPAAGPSSHPYSSDAPPGVPSSMHHPNATSHHSHQQQHIHHPQQSSAPHHHVLYTKTETVSVASPNPHALKLDKFYSAADPSDSFGRSSSRNKSHARKKKSSSSSSRHRSYSSAASGRHHTSESSGRPVAYKAYNNFKKWIPKYPYHRSVKKVFSRIKQPQSYSSFGRKSKVRLFHAPTPTKSRSKRKSTRNRRQVYAVDSSYFDDGHSASEDEMMMSTGVNVSALNSSAPHYSSKVNSSYHHPAQYKMRNIPPRSQTDLGMSSARSVSSRNGGGTRKKKKKRNVFSRTSSRRKRPKSRAGSAMSHYSNGAGGVSRAKSSAGHRSVSSLLQGSSPKHVRIESNMDRSYLQGQSLGKSPNNNARAKSTHESSRPMYYNAGSSTKYGASKSSNKHSHRVQVNSNHTSKPPTHANNKPVSAPMNHEDSTKKQQHQEKNVKPTIQAKPRRSSVALEQTMESTFESLSKYKFGDQDDSYTNYNGVDLHIDLVMYQFFVSSTTERYRQFDLVEKMVEQVPNLEKISKGIDIESIKRKMRRLAASS